MSASPKVNRVRQRQADLTLRFISRFRYRASREQNCSPTPICPSPTHILNDTKGSGKSPPSNPWSTPSLPTERQGTLRNGDLLRPPSRGTGADRRGTLV